MNSFPLPMTVDRFNAIADLIEADVSIHEHSAIRHEIEFVKSFIEGFDGKTIIHVCSLHSTILEEYEPGMIRCPKCKAANDD